MATYEGRRLAGEGVGETAVTVDGKPLPLRLDVVNHSPTGFEWGYEGSGPAQLALAILAHHFSLGLKDRVVRTLAEGRAVRLHQSFKRAFVATWDGDWKLTGDEIDRWLGEQQGAHP